MEGFVVSYSLDNEQQFWDELDDICSMQCNSSQLIDQALRTYLHFTTNFKDEYLASDHAVASSIAKLLESELFKANEDYVRIQLVYSLLQEDEPATLYIIASFLLFDGRRNEDTFKIMNKEGSFARLVELIKCAKDEDSRLHRLLLELLYDMSRMQKLSLEDLSHVDDDFVKCQFQIIEELSDDVNDPYHYPIIRVLLVLNEQYMVAATTAPDATSVPATNRVVKVLSGHGQDYMTFGENIILLLNRETETSLQLLILKLLYLLFTTEATREYFYTNDLRVLLDVIIRNLLDLPNELISLRHTYLRVLYPLLAHTQLAQPPHYKRNEILKVLALLSGSGNVHFAPADETTTRLVGRVGQVPWLNEGKDTNDADLSRKLLGISLPGSQTESSVSVVDLAGLTEKPGIQTPSRRTEAALHTPADGVNKRDRSDADGVTFTIPPPATSHRDKQIPPKAPPRRRTKLKTPINIENTGDQ